jgi:hypothetical protein
MPDKTCPKCPDSPVMKSSAVLSVVPVQMDVARSSTMVGNVGLSVRIYQCPTCKIVELYQEGEPGL